MARAGAIISAARRSFGEWNRTAISWKRSRPSAVGRERVDRSRGEQSLRERCAKTGFTGRYLRTTRLLNLWERRRKERKFRVDGGARIRRVERIAHGEEARLMRYTRNTRPLCVSGRISPAPWCLPEIYRKHLQSHKSRPPTTLLSRPRLDAIITIYRDDCEV